MHKVGVVIPFFDGHIFMDKLLQELEGDRDFELFVFIVDNSKLSQKITVKPRANFPLEILSVGEGLGYGRACNLGYNTCRERGLDYMVVMNQDGFLPIVSLSNLIHVLRAVGASITMPIMMEYNSNNIESFYIDVYLSKIDGLISDSLRRDVKSAYPLSDLCGACFALDLKRYHEDILFDELFHMYFEDGDLALRISNTGQQMVLVPNAFFHHAHANTNEEIQTIKKRGIQRSSHMLFQLKFQKGSLFKLMLGWFFLELGNLISLLLKLNVRGFVIEVNACILTIIKIPKLSISRQNGYFKFND
jgi:GT2 family glycosyltransferase